MALPDEPLTRSEQYLNRTATGSGTIPDEPLTRAEMYLNKIATGDGDIPEVPLTRMEQYLDYIAENGGGGGGSGGKEIVRASWHQCPEAVRNYLANVDYTGVPYTQSSIETYAPNPAVIANSKPIGYTTGGVTYYNNAPNVETFFQNTQAVGTLKPLDALRWINCPSALNVRDIGGWPCDGGTVKYGKLYRSGELAASDASVLVEQLGIGWELSLLGTDSSATSSVLGSNVGYTRPSQYVWYSLLDHGGTTDAWVSILRCVFNAVNNNTPLIFDCSAGADRTGTVAYVLETLLGVSQSNCDKDYELTSFSGTFRKRSDYGCIKDLVDEINALQGSSFTQKLINWVMSLGFTADDINGFRRRMINGYPTIIAAPTPTSYTNLVPTSIDTDGTVFNGVGYEDGYRLRSNAMPSIQAGCVCTGFIPAVLGDVIRFKGVAWNVADTGSEYSGKCYLHECTAAQSGAIVGSKRNDQYNLAKNGDVYEYTVGYSNCQYIRLNGVGNGASLIVTKNEPIE